MSISKRSDSSPSHMKVAILIRKWSIRAGNERVATEVASYLQNQGHQVSIYCQKMDGSAEGIIDSKHIHRLGGLSFEPTLAMLSFVRATNELVANLKVSSPDTIVMGFNHSTQQDVYRLGAGTHEEFLRQTAQAGRSGGRILNYAALKMEQKRFLPGRFQRLIAPSKAVSQELQKHYGISEEYIDVVYNGVDNSRFCPAESMEERMEMRSAWGLSSDEKVAIFVGQDLRRKGFEEAVQATQSAGCRLVYAGKASKPSHLSPHVIWAGEHRQVERCYRAADAFILPTHYEPFGGVLLEAYASGLPVISTQRAGATELANGTILEDLIVENPQDIQALATALSKAFSGYSDFSAEARLIGNVRKLETFGKGIETSLRCALSQKRRT